MAKIGSLSVVLSLASAKFEAGMKRAKVQVKGFSAAIGRVRNTMRGFGRAMAVPVAAIGAFGAAASLMVKRSLAAIDTTSKFSQRIGIAIDKLRGLELAAKLSGVEVRTLHLALQRMTRRVAEAAQGTGEAKKAIEELGVDAGRLVKLSVDEQFMLLAEAMERVESQSDRVRLAMRLFDSEGVAIVNTMKGGTAAIQEAFDQSEKFGNSLQAIDAAKVEVVNDAFTRAGTAISGLRDQLTVGLTGTLAALAETMEAWAVRAVGNIDTINAAVQRGIGAGVRTGGGGMKLVKGAVQLLRGTGAAVGAGISAALTVPTQLSPNVKDAMERVTMGFWDTATKAFKSGAGSIWDVLGGAHDERITRFMHEADIRFQGAARERAKSLPTTAGMPSTDFAAMLQELRSMNLKLDNLGTMPG